MGAITSMGGDSTVGTGAEAAGLLAWAKVEASWGSEVRALACPWLTLLAGHARGFRDAGESEEVDRDLAVAQEILGGTKLLGVAVHEGERGVAAGKRWEWIFRPGPRGPSPPPAACGSPRTSGLGRVVERARALSGHPEACQLSYSLNPRNQR